MVMESFSNTLAKIYSIDSSISRKRIHEIESYVNIAEPFQVSEDDIRNLPELHANLYLGLGSNQLCSYIVNVLQKWGIARLSQTSDLYNAVDFLRTLVATSTYRYHIELMSGLKYFASEFDRLDLLEELERLHRLASMPSFHCRIKNSKQ